MSRNNKLNYFDFLISTLQEATKSSQKPRTSSTIPQNQPLSNNRLRSWLGTSWLRERKMMKRTGCNLSLKKEKFYSSSKNKRRKTKRLNSLFRKMSCLGMVLVLLR
jgi:hypothetical protein